MKDLLPQEPLDVPIDPWWVVHVVNVGESSCLLTVCLRFGPRESAPGGSVGPGAGFVRGKGCGLSDGVRGVAVVPLSC